MSNIVRKSTALSVIVSTVFALALQGGMAQAQTKTPILWFVGMGTGTNDQQIAAEKKVVSEFNASQDKIDLQIQIAPTFETAVASITTLIAAGNAPDIVGPVGVGGSNSFADRWLDLKDLIAKNKFDVSQFDPAVLSLYATLNGGYNAIPFAVYPATTIYNPALFDEAGLKYPPAKAGDMYVMPDGSKVAWDYTTVGKIAKILTVDKDGNDATSAKFDPKNIVQYGLNMQYALIRLMLTDIQPSAFYDATTKKIKISDDWVKGINWLKDATWKDHFFVNNTADASLQPSAFDSGKVAMTIVPLWYTCCMTDTAKAGTLKWQMGVVPASLDGKTHVAVDADTFRIDKSTKNPDAAFTVLTYLLGPAVAELAPAYGAFPALAKYQQGWIDSENKTYTQGVNWQVAIDSMKYTNPSNLHHESNLPHFQLVQDRFDKFKTLLFSDSGATMDVNKEIASLTKDLQSIVDGTAPTYTPVPTAVPTAAATTAS